MTLELHGYHYSAYTRIARVALAEKGLAHRHVEVDPFAEAVTPRRQLQPRHFFARL